LKKNINKKSGGYGVVRPPKKQNGVVETIPKNLGNGSATPVWPRGGFNLTRPTSMRVVQPPPQGKKKKKKKIV
jgi:hypothetical protein